MVWKLILELQHNSLSTFLLIQECCPPSSLAYCILAQPTTKKCSRKVSYIHDLYTWVTFAIGGFGNLKYNTHVTKKDHIFG